MNSILVVMTRDLLYRCRWNFLVVLALANLISLLLIAIPGYHGSANIDPEMRIWLFRIMSLNAVFGGMTLLNDKPFSSRLLVAPVSNTMLVAYQLFPQMLIGALNTSFLIALQNWYFSQSFPTWSPPLFTACCVTICWSTFWGTHPSPLQPVALLLIVGSSLAWYFSRFAFLQQSYSDETSIPALSTLECLCLLGVTACFYYVGNRGFSRFRCSAGGLNRQSVIVRDPGIQKPVIRHKPFLTPSAAQLWFEWRSKGWVLPLFVFTAILVSFVTWSIRSGDPNELFKGFVAAGFLSSFLCGIVGGFAIGNYGFSWTMDTQSMEFDLGQFLGSRPLTNTSLACTNLISLGISVIVGWAIWAIGFFMSYLAYRKWGSPDVDTIFWWYLPVTLLFWWTATAVSASVMLTGENRRIPRLIMTGLSILVVAVALSNWAFDSEFRSKLFHDTVSLGGIGAIVGSCWLFYVARDRQLIQTSTALICALIWIFFTTLIAVERWRHATLPMSAYLFAMGLAALAVVPLAAAPLAIARNRSR